jgi:hypothetical protein
MVVLGCVHEHVHGKIGAATPLSLRNDATQEASTVLVTLGSIFILAPVPDARKEGVALVACAMVEFDPIESGATGTLSGRRPDLYSVFDLLLGHCTAW